MSPDDVLDHEADILARTELEANLNAAGAHERYQYCQTSSNDCFSNNAPEASHDRHSRKFQVITGRAAREGARERVCFAQKPIAATKVAMWASSARGKIFDAVWG